MKSILSILVFLFLPAMLFGQSTDWYSGDGPYTISTEADLIGLRELVSSGNSFDGKIILLADDIALTSANWVSIGSDVYSNVYPFKGTLDGQGRTISGLAANRSQYAGLFGYVGTNGQIKNLNVEATTIATTSSGTTGYTGGLAAYYASDKPIENCSVNADSINSYNYSGGLVGYANSALTITNSYTSGNVTTTGGGAYSGGLVGFANSALTITNSYTSGNVTATGSGSGRGSGYSGGLVGYTLDMVFIKNSYASGHVAVRGNTSCSGGGLIGLAAGTLTSIGNSYASGNVTTINTSSGLHSCGGGGLVGTTSSSGRITITNSYANGNIYAGGYDYGGGLVGSAANQSVITTSYASGNIFGNSDYYRGGIFGQYVRGTNTNVYYNSEGGASKAAGVGSPAGISAMPSAELKKQETYIGWDFNEIWDVVEGATYPYLKTPKITVPIGDFEVEYFPVQTYTGSQITPEPIVKLTSDKTVLIKDTDYTLEYGENKSVGTIGRVTIIGISEDYITLEESVYFDITPKNITITDAAAQDKIYDGTADATIVGTLYGVVEGDNVSIGKGEFASKNVGIGISISNVALTGTSAANYKLFQPIDLTATITKKALTVIGAQVTEKIYDGTTAAAITEANLVGVFEGDIDNISISNLTGAFATANAGTNIAVSTNMALSGTAAANYSLTQPVLTGTITAKSLATDAIQTIDSQTYTGSAIKPSITVKDGSTTLAAVGYEIIAWENNTNAGTNTASVTIEGKGNYQGTATANFTISPKNLPTNAIQTIADETYTGSAITPSITVKDGSTTLAAVGYEIIAWENNTNAGTNTASVTIEGKGNYQGTATANFTISPKNLPTNAIQTIADETYTGSAITPSITVKDGSTTLAAVGYEIIAWENNTNAGTASVQAAGIGNYAGTADATFVILPKNLISSMLGAIAEQLYTGEEITPNITVSDGNVILVAGTDYEVSYSNNINAGLASVSITGKGNYASEVNTSFEIVAPSSSSSDDAPASSSSSDDTPSSSSSNDTPSSSSSSDIATPSSSSNGGTPIRSPQIAVSNQAAQIYNGINLQATNDAIIEVFNMQGNSINKQHFGNGVYTVPLGHLPKGLYIVKISFGSQKQILRVPVR